MTVSKVLRDARDVSEGTKARIRQIAEEMGYVPDALARGLRTRRTKLFGLVVPDLPHPLLSQVAMAVQDCAHELGYDLLIAQTHDSAPREEACLRRLLSRRVDGLFVYPVYRLAPTAPAYDELRKSGTPAVLLGPAAPFCEGLPGVSSDDEGASCSVTQHLLQLGHRQIAVTSPALRLRLGPKTVSAAIARLCATPRSPSTTGSSSLPEPPWKRAKARRNRCSTNRRLRPRCKRRPIWSRWAPLLSFGRRPSHSRRPVAGRVRKSSRRRTPARSADDGPAP